MNDQSVLGLDYAFDANGQLAGVGGDQSAQYPYDAAGNRADGSGGQVYQIGPGNQLANGQGFRFRYDAAGNLRRKIDDGADVRLDLQYDHRNRLVGAQRYDSTRALDGSATYRHDGLGRRIGQVVDPDGDGEAPSVTTWMISDGDQVYADLDAAGGSPIRYLHGEAVDQLLARTDATGDTAWYLTDRLGSVRKVANAAGEVTGALDFDPFGKPLARTGDVDRFGFTGREYEPATGLQHNRHREYDPALGRWTSRDPIGLAGGDANLYRYVGNEPTRLVDPFGLRPPAADSPGAPAPTLPPAPTRPPSMTPIGVDDGSPAEVEGRRAGEFLRHILARDKTSKDLAHRYVPEDFGGYNELLAVYLGKYGTDGQALLSLAEAQGVRFQVTEGTWGFSDAWTELGVDGALIQIAGQTRSFPWLTSSPRHLGDQASLLHRELGKLVGEAYSTPFFRGLNLYGPALARAIELARDDERLLDDLQRAYDASDGTARLFARAGETLAVQSATEAAAGSAGGFSLFKLLKALKSWKRIAAVGKTIERVEDIAPNAELQAARQRIAGQIDEVARRRSLGADPASGRYRLSEEEAALRLERHTGRQMRRDPSGTGDWLDSAGRTYDAVGPVPGGRFNLDSFTNQINKHLLKQRLDHVVVDVSGLSAAERAAVMSHIGGLTPAQQARIIVQPR